MKLVLVIVMFGSFNLLAQTNDIRMFIFGNSLVHHEFQVNPTPSDETSVPHWLHFLSEAGENSLEVAGQYGFLPQHANLPPFSQWGFDFALPAWDSDNVSFAEANFSHILITPGNFIQWQDPDVNYPYESISPVSASNSVVEWCAAQEDGLNFYIYEGWPEMAPYLNAGFPPTDDEWDRFNEFLQTDYVDWFDQYHGMVMEANPDECLRIIPVARLISRLLQQEPYDQIAIEQLYEDDAPHGRPSIYFLASMITYMAMYEEEVPLDYMANEFIDPIIIDNYAAINSFFWNELLNFNDENENTKVFCKLNVAVDESASDASPVTLHPNPFGQSFYIQNKEEELLVKIFNGAGKMIRTEILKAGETKFDLTGYEDGIFFLKTVDRKGQILEFKKLVKISN